jgi:predicted RNase H-like HicB family nuclease
MKHFMIEVQRDGNFFVAQCLEEESCFTQGKTLQETIRNMREVLELMLDVKGPQLEVRLRHDAVEVFV